jgi:formylglycine-generating enzyme
MGWDAMSYRSAFALTCAVFLLPELSVRAGETDLFILDTPDGVPGRYIFKTEPGLRYDLWESTDLAVWTAVGGWPKPADALSAEYAYPVGPKRFFRHQALDEQAPTLVEQSPAENSFAVGRFDDFRIVLKDASGIDPATVRLTIGASGPMALGAPGLTFANNTLRYDSGATALGAYGQSLTATLVAADLGGRTLTRTWSFRLETQPLVAASLFVFGSNAARQTGQQVSGPMVDVAARFSPPVLPLPAPTWSLALVAADRVVISFTGATPPTFAVGQFITNFCPTRTGEIFHRRIVSLSLDAGTHELTLMTSEAKLTDLVASGSVALTADSALLTTAADGTITHAANFAVEGPVPRLGFDLAGSSYALTDDGFSRTLTTHLEPPSITLPPAALSMGTHPDLFVGAVREGSFWFAPKLRASVELSGSALQRFEAVATGAFETAMVLDGRALAVGTSASQELYNLPSASEPQVTLLLGALGPVPVFGSLGLDFSLKAEAQIASVADFSFGQRSTTLTSLGISYKKDQPLSFIREVTTPTPDFVTPTVGTPFTGRVKFSALPEVKFSVYGLVGTAIGADVSAEATGTPSGGGAPRVGLQVGVTAMVKGTGPALDSLNLPEAAFQIWRQELTRSSQPLAIESEPISLILEIGRTATFNVVAQAPGAVTYHWYHQGRPIPGATGRSLVVPNIGPSHAGDYQVRLTSGSHILASQIATLTVLPLGTLDTDGDGLPNAVETQSGLWADAAHRGTHPFRWDSDGDSLPDGVETNTGRYVSAADTGTDPNRADTDGDGIRDDHEAALGTLPTVPTGFALIPAGSFIMGDQSSPLAGDPFELPTRSVFVSAFFMATTEVTKTQWDVVTTYAVANGYIFEATGSGKAPLHPVVNLSWNDAVKWCNARSQRDGLQPCYTVNGAVLKTGATAPVCDFTRNGYRLPTEAEWERAARGGLSGQNFPRGNTITHSEANYYSQANYTYDVSPTRGYHPDGTGGFPYTSPVGTMTANNFGLSEMSGNAWEWCWDWYSGSGYTGAGTVDPRGPATGTARILRGGSWNVTARYCRIATRYWNLPAVRDQSLGLRLVQGRP